MYKILLSKAAVKEYAGIYKSDRRIFYHIRNAMHFISKDPQQGKPLRLNLKGLFSYRVGMYRIIYSIEHKILTVHVLDIGHRRDVYK